MSPMRQQILIGLALAALTLSVYSGVRKHEFINYDDDVYVTANRNVNTGLTGSNIAWAWTTFDASNWHPLTWLSLQLDASLCRLLGEGLNPTVFHLTSLFWHTANVVLLFGVLGRMTGALWRSAFVAALFAVHPLHVESVAWVAERKDVLSTFFWILTLGLYQWYVEGPSLRRYLLVVLSFALGLLAKPMLVTLPFVLLLLDYWPLQRLRRGQEGMTLVPLLKEKVPLLALSAVSCGVTVVAQHKGGAIHALDSFSVLVRFENALVAYVGYLARTLWPVDLAVFYPHPGDTIAPWQAGAAGLLLVAVTVLVIKGARRWPYLPVGWLWFVGTLVPVIGLVQVGDQAMADRYTYVPHIGLFLAVVWGLANLLTRWQYAAAAVGAIVLVVCAVLTVRQVGRWHDSETLWRHTLAVTTDNRIAHNNLGECLAMRDKYQEAAKHFVRAVTIMPEYADAHFNLGQALFELGQYDGAMEHYLKALTVNPSVANVDLAHYRLAHYFMGHGKLDEARTHALQALDRGPRPEADRYYLLGVILSQQGRWQEAVSPLRAAVALRPSEVTFYRGLAYALYQGGDREAAMAEYDMALKIDPHWRENANTRAWQLATAADPRQRSAAEACYIALQVCQATDFERPEYLDTLAAAYAANGQFDKAVTAARKALSLATSPDQAERAAKIKERLELYEKRQPFRQAPSATPPGSPPAHR